MRERNGGRETAGDSGRRWETAGDRATKRERARERKRGRETVGDSGRQQETAGDSGKEVGREGENRGGSERGRYGERLSP